MNSKKLYIIRHGQTDFNKKGIVQGRGVNSSLNELGRLQSLHFFNSYKDVPFQKVYTSSLKRTQETVEPFLNAGLKHESLQGLDEISWGIAEGKSFDENLNGMYYNLLKAWQEGDVDQCIEGGESPKRVQERQEVAIKKILEDPEELVLVCMHGRAMRILLAWMTQLGLHNMDTFEHDNLCLYQVSFSQNRFSIDIHNETKHLQSISS